MPWTSGYVADIGYTFGYYTELNPLRVNLAFLNTGLVCPKIHIACELGYGQALSETGTPCILPTWPKAWNLTGRIEAVQIDGQESCALIDNNSLKLGGNGLSIIALAKYCEVARSQTYVSLMQELAK